MSALVNTAPTTYAIRVDGHLDDHWSAWLGGLDMTRDDDGATTVTVEVADQAQLHGVLAGLRDIGAVISELRTRDAPVPIRRSVLERPLHTERLTLRPLGRFVEHVAIEHVNKNVEDGAVHQSVTRLNNAPGRFSTRPSSSRINIMEAMEPGGKPVRSTRSSMLAGSKPRASNSIS